MDTANLITLIGIFLGFIGTCITSAVSVKKSNSTVNQNISELKKQVAKNSEHDKEQYLAILRLTVMAEEMPTSERIIAGKKYIDEGGNGDVKKFYESFVKEHTI